MLGITEKTFRKHRQKLGIRPVYKRVDTCAAEFATDTAYMYSTYEEECEANPSDREDHRAWVAVLTVLVRVSNSRLLLCARGTGGKEEGYEAIMVNCNPETVSTDYDTFRPSVLRAGNPGRRAGNR